MADAWCGLPDKRLEPQMGDLNVRSDSVDVEQIMRQIRARIREKRGVDYTEAELQQLASVKLEKFLDPRGVRSDLVEQFRKHRFVSAAPPNYSFEDTTLYESHRPLLRFVRKLLNPVLLLFFNPNRLTSALHIQAQVNDEYHKLFRRREDMDPLFYEVIHNLVVECTRLGVEVHNLKMRVESLGSRLDFDERRGRSLESVVQYRRATPEPRESRSAGESRSPGEARGQGESRSPGETRSPGESRGPGEMRSPGESRGPGESRSPGEMRGPGGGAAAEGGGQQRPWGEGGGGRRRRRRRRRRPGQTMGDQERSPRESRGPGESRSPGESRGPGESTSPGEMRSPGDGGGGSDEAGGSDHSDSDHGAPDQ